ncbi:hypothetical protein [Streptomyces sp. URMC 127]|uniref:hypothetical protein n=1 Tax=Streptomyces sp. URMC 127 TaxID=3423402 RepID=UPI003F531387
MFAKLLGWRRWSSARWARAAQMCAAGERWHLLTEELGAVQWWMVSHFAVAASRPIVRARCSSV